MCSWRRKRDERIWAPTAVLDKKATCPCGPCQESIRGSTKLSVPSPPYPDSSEMATTSPVFLSKARKFLLFSKLACPASSMAMTSSKKKLHDGEDERPMFYNKKPLFSKVRISALGFQNWLCQNLTIFPGPLEKLHMILGWLKLFYSWGNHMPA